jgi:Carboxypeptidase regulatory-like domain
MPKAERRMRRGCGPRTGFKLNAAGWMMAGCLLLGAATTLSRPLAAAAQANATRVIQGKVQLASGAPAQGAIVYLKNGKTLEVRTYISIADGSYRFGQLSTDADYTLWAEYQGKKSKEKSVSSFDTKKILEITLKVEAS